MSDKGLVESVRERVALSNVVSALGPPPGGDVILAREIILVVRHWFDMRSRDEDVSFVTRRLARWTARLIDRELHRVT